MAFEQNGGEGFHSFTFFHVLYENQTLGLLKLKVETFLGELASTFPALGDSPSRAPTRSKRLRDQGHLPGEACGGQARGKGVALRECLSTLHGCTTLQEGAPHVRGLAGLFLSFLGLQHLGGVPTAGR